MSRTTDSLPAISRRTRNPGSYTEPPQKFIREVDPGLLNLSLSKDKLLLLDLYSPDYYTVRVTQIKASATARFPFTLHIYPESQGVTISPEEIVFTSPEQEAEVLVFTTVEPAIASVLVAHTIKGKGDMKIILTAYFVNKGAYRVYSSGLDDHFQLASDLSVKAFLEEYLSDETQNRSATCNPVPQVIYGNDVYLFHQEKGDSECAVEPPAWASLAAGESHALACTNEGKVYAWGLSVSGQLGLGPGKNQEVTQELCTKLGYKQKTVSGSPYASHQSHSELLTSSVPVPSLIPELEQAVQVTCGSNHSLVLLRNHQVFSFGKGDSGQLGHGTRENALAPTLVQELVHIPIAKITAGYNTSFFIDTEGILYSCGAASSGALGHGLADVLLPTKVPKIDPVHQCSSGESHTGVVTFEGVVIMFGNPSEGRLGSTESYVRHSPAVFENKRARAVYCGGVHTHVLTEDLELYSFGGNRKGQLGLTRSDFQYLLLSALEQPMHNDYFAGKAVSYVSVGHEHSMALTLNGLIYAWGSNSRGQLGICTLGKDFTRVGLPRLLEANLKEPGTIVACGHRTSFFATAGQHPDSHTYLFNQWKKKLIEEDRSLQERANYRYSIIRRQINYEKLSKRIQSEREQSLQRASPTFDHHSPKKAGVTSESYYEFWNTEKFLSSEDERRQVYSFDLPAHEGKKGTVTVTVFKGLRTEQPVPKEMSTSSPNLREATNFASIDGSIALDQSLGKLSTPRGGPQAERPVYYERTDFEPTYRHYPTLRTQTLFPPYSLVPNPMLLGPNRRLA